MKKKRIREVYKRNSFCKDERKMTTGITLAALVVTIVVLLILAGITIMYVMGENGVFGRASQAKIQTELGKIEERASLIYSDKLIKKVSTDLNTKPTMQEIVEELRNQGNQIEEISVDGDGIIGILLDRENMTLGFGGTNKIKVTLERSDISTDYYAIVDGKYYKMQFNGGLVTIDRKPSEVSNEGTKQTLNISNSDDTVATATLEKSTNTITVIATNEVGTTTVTITYGSYTKTCIITVKDIPITTSIELNSVRARIATGYTRWITAMTTPMGALQEFEWRSSDTNIATVDKKGVVTAKRAGTATITAKTIDGSNKEGTCTVTVVENAVDVATLTEIQSGEKNIIARDSNGNLITVPVGFKVLTSEGTKVTDGIVISDDTNEFVWVPVDSVSTGTEKPADDIRLGRYKDFTTKNATGNYVPSSNADDIENNQELEDIYGSSAFRRLVTFISCTKANGGYYLARYEASGGFADTKADVKSQYNKPIWNYASKATAESNCLNMYQGNPCVGSDLINSYAWDTALVFIQKYSENSNYANQSTKKIGNAPFNTGTSGDSVCNIHDMASNCNEWTFDPSGSPGWPYFARGGRFNSEGQYVASTYMTPPELYDYLVYVYLSFRPLLYLK